MNLPFFRMSRPFTDAEQIVIAQILEAEAHRTIAKRNKLLEVKELPGCLPRTNGPLLLSDAILLALKTQPMTNEQIAAAVVWHSVASVRTIVPHLKTRGLVKSDIAVPKRGSKPAVLIHSLTEAGHRAADGVLVSEPSQEPEAATNEKIGGSVPTFVSRVRSDLYFSSGEPRVARITLADGVRHG